MKITAKEFQLTDKEYEDFVAYAKQTDYTYTTEGEKELESFKKNAEEDKQFDDVKKEYETLLAKLAESKKDDFNKFKMEIKRVVESEIVSRTYYEAGRLEASLKYDSELLEAQKVAADEAKIKTILSTIEKPTKPFNSNKKF